MRQPAEAFTWNHKLYEPAKQVPDDDPAVGKFPHLFVPLPEEPAKRGPGRPRKVEE